MKKFLSIILALTFFFIFSFSCLCINEKETALPAASQNVQREEKPEFRVTLPRVLWAGAIVIVFAASQIIIKKRTEKK